MSYSIDGVDWTKYLDRKQPLLLFAAFIRPYGSLLQEAVGFRFRHQLHIFSRNTGTFVKSARELEAATAFFLGRAKEGGAELIEWRDRGVVFNKEADALIASAQAGTLSISKENAWEVWRLIENVMLYDTVIPFRIMVSVNAAMEQSNQSMPEALRRAQELFEPFRAGAKYPELVEHVFPLFFEAAARELRIEDAALLSNATPLELRAILEGSVRLDEAELSERKAWCAFWGDPETGAVEFSFDKAPFEALGLVADHAGVAEVKGSVAYPGVARGTARILNSASDIKEFRDGDIIVSFNTNPSLMPALRRCGGIVTDEGGIMCHAAILSRELEVPCVIGTKVATRAFKDGDLLEVDAEKGIVRKI